MKSLVGSSLLSAAASLPIHLLPLLVFAVSQEGRLSPSQSGWIGSAYMLGQLGAVLLLPTLRFYRVTWTSASIAAVALFSATLATDSFSTQMVLGSWLTVGAACGTLQFLATSAAAASSAKHLAFSMRMAMSSLMGACAIAAMQLGNAGGNYSSLSVQLAYSFAAIAAFGLMLYRTPATKPASVPETGSPQPAQPLFAGGFFVLFILFVGQHGLWACTIQNAKLRGFLLENILWVIFACKLVAGGTVLAGALTKSSLFARPVLLVPAFAVAIGGIVMASALQMEILLLGFLAWEIGFSVLSVRLQSILAHQDPKRAGMWMTATIFLGAASGPALATWVAANMDFTIFVAFGVITALVPLVLASQLRHAISGKS